MSKPVNLIKLSKKIVPKVIRPKVTKEQELEHQKTLIRLKSDLDYSKAYNTNMQYEEKELNIFNHKGWITGYLDNDYSSSELVLMRCSQKKPKGIILGDCNINDFPFFEKGMQKYLDPVKINPISGENLIARQMFLNFFRGNFTTNLNYVKEEADYTISQLDHAFKRKMFNCTLSVSNYACFYDQVKIIFGSPNKLIHFEDLVLNHSLSELQVMFVQSLEEYKKRADVDAFPPPLYPPEFAAKIVEISQDIHNEKLYDKKCMYTAAVFRKIHKLYPDNILFMPNYLAQRTYQHITDSFCSDYDEIYRDKEFTLKLKDLNSDLNSLEELLEKICIVSHLIHNEFSFYIINGQNPLKLLFGGKFSNYPDDIVRDIYMKIQSLYKDEIERMFYEDLKRIQDTFSFTRKENKSYREEIQKWEKFSPLKKEKLYPENIFVLDKYRKQEAFQYSWRILIAQIGLNIKLKEMKGQNMNILKNHLRNYLAGIVNKQNTDIFNECLVEANAQLGLIKLPSSFKKYTNLLNKTLYSNLEEILGTDPNEAHKTAVIKLYNQLKGIDPFIVKDGSEAEMKQQVINRNRVNLIDTCYDYIFDKEETKKIESVTIKSEDSPIETYDISKEEDETVKNKLTILREIWMAEKDQEQGGSLVTLKQGDFDARSLKTKSIEELKQLDIENVGEYLIEVDEDRITNQTLSENQHEIMRLDKHVNISQELKQNMLNVTSVVPENNFFTSAKTIHSNLIKSDIKRAQIIAKALEDGEYLDDPIYLEMLMTDDKYLKQREKVLKEYFTGKKSKGTTLVERYANKPGDIAENMQKDGVYYKHDSPEGRQKIELYRQLAEEINEEEEDENSLIKEKIGNWDQVAEKEEDQVFSLHQFINERIEDMKMDQNKKIYNNFLSNDNSEHKVDNEEVGVKGRNLKKKEKGKNKKLNLL